MILYHNKEEYLQLFSQAIYDTIEILKIHFTDPIEIDKKLDRYYSNIKKDIDVMVGEKIFPELNHYYVELPESILVIRSYILENGTNPEKIIAQAEKFLGKIQILRLENDKYEPTTGVKSVELKLYLQKLKDEKFKLRHALKTSSRKNKEEYDESAVVEIIVNGLESYTDGSIRYKSKHIPLPVQIRELCRLFMENRNDLINYDQIKERIINASKREKTSNSTISKYVSKLRKILFRYLNKDVFKPVAGSGYIFNPD